MAIMNEAVPRDEVQDVLAGKKIPKKKVVPRPEEPMPKVEEFIRFDDIPLLEFERIAMSTMRRIQNENGVHLIGYDVIILLKAKRRVGRPSKEEEDIEPQPRILKGWMIEGDFEKLKRNAIR